MSETFTNKSNTFIRSPQPGDLIQLKESSLKTLTNRLIVRPMLFLLEKEQLSTDNIKNGVYHHQLVVNDKGSYDILEPGSIVMVVQFFVKPQYIKYITSKPNQTIYNTSKSIIISSSTSSSIGSNFYEEKQTKEFKGYIAYVSHKEKIWATDIFSSLEEFLSSYKIVSN